MTAGDNPNRLPAAAHTPTAPPNLAFPHKLIQQGEVTPASWERFAGAMWTALHGMTNGADDPRLADLSASLGVPAEALGAMPAVDRNRWMSDHFRAIAAQCATLSRQVGSGDRELADFAVLLGELMTELKRQTLLSSVSGELRHHGKVAAANLARQYAVDEAMRPLDAVQRSNSIAVTGGGGHNWLLKAVACLSAALGSERRVSSELDGDGQLMSLGSLGVGASVRLGVNALLASLDVSVGSSATRKRGSLAVAPTLGDLSAALAKARHDEKPDTLPIVGRSASPTARTWAARLSRCRNRMARIGSGFRAYAPDDEPYWISKTPKGFNTANVRELLQSLNERANQRLPQEHGDLIAVMAADLFPLESEIRAALGPLGSRTVEEIRAIKNAGDDVYAVPAAPTDDVTGRRRKHHVHSVEAAITASARAGSDYVPIGLSAKAGVGGTVSWRHIDVQRVQHDLLNLVGIDATGDPATAYRALSAVQRQLEAVVREQHRRLGIDTSRHPALHPYLALLHGTEPDLPMPDEPQEHATRSGAAPMLDFYGRYPDMPPQHRQALQAMVDGAMEPADLLGHVEAAYEALYDVACQLHDDTESMASGSAERREQAVHNINHQVFGGGYDVPAAADTKEARATRATLASHAHNALSLAVWNLSLYQMMAKECFAERAAREPSGPAQKEAWTALSRRVDERYLQLKETVVDPLQANRLETTHRLSPIVAKAPCNRSAVTLTADLSIGSDGLIDSAAHHVNGSAGTLLGGLPGGPSLGAGGSLGVTVSDTFDHPNLLKRGSFITSNGTLTVPAGTGVLTGVIARTLAGIRDDQGFGPALSRASSGVLTEAVEDIVKHGDFHALLTRSPGVGFEVQTRVPPMIDGLQPRPGVQYALLAATEKKGFGASLPNLLALTPWTQNGVLEASVSTTVSRTNTRVMHYGDEIGFLLLRLSDTGTGKLFKRVKAPADPKAATFTASPPETLDHEATFQAFDADRFEKEALFGSPYQPVLSALITLAEFDSTRPFATLKNEDGNESAYVSPLASFVKGSRWRVSHIGPWARHFAAGSGTDPFADPTSLGPLDDLAKKSLQWKRDEPELLSRLRALKTTMAGWSADDRLRFFTRTDEGRELLSRFWEFTRAHRELMAANFAGASMEAEANHAALAAVPTVLGAASRRKEGPLRRLLVKLGIGRSSTPDEPALDPAFDPAFDPAYGDSGGFGDNADALSIAAERRIHRMTAPSIEAGVGDPFTPQAIDPARSISGKELDLPQTLRSRARSKSLSSMLHSGWNAVGHAPRALARTPGAIHGLPGRFLLPPNHEAAARPVGQAERAPGQPQPQPLPLAA